MSSDVLATHFEKAIPLNPSDVLGSVSSSTMGLGVLGLTALVIIVMSVFLLLPNLGPKFLSGQRLDATSGIQRYVIRFVFIGAAAAWMFGVMSGTKQAVGAVDTAITTLQEVNNDVYIFGLNSSLQYFRLLGDASDRERLRDKLISRIVSNKTGFVCDNATDYFRDQMDIDLSVSRNASSSALKDVPIFKWLYELDNFRVDDDAKSMEVGLNNLRTSTLRMSFKLLSLEETLTMIPPTLIMVPFFLIAIALIFGTLIGLCNKRLPCCLEGVLSWFFFPILMLLTILAAAVTSILSVIASANQSFCSPPTVGGDADSNLFVDVVGPQLSTLYFLQTILGWDPNTLNVLKYYFTGCTETNPFGPMDAYTLEYIPQALDAVNKFSVSLTQNINITTALALCNITTIRKNKVKGLIETTEETLQMLNVFDTLVSDIVNTTSCDKIIPIFKNALENGICTETVGQSKMAVLFFTVVTVAGCLMILFRSAIVANEEEEDDDSDDDSSYDRRKRKKKSKSSSSSKKGSSKKSKKKKKYDSDDDSSDDEERGKKSSKKKKKKKKSSDIEEGGKKKKKKSSKSSSKKSSSKKSSSKKSSSKKDS
eukprot:CAMPEP_0194144794 /NCGR_PEP_ID=MMETSP0152-20130528/13808_1 /TAXON_ID=1049557 /ORGANISM="Thalassiothrix antarctica, Strain L6-D1" /LENGTH=594 /DNA_ID=CAMNT_0038844795 /DNA_START=46 /DNA_END=1826 /DNA_ORIENTATION=+